MASTTTRSSVELRGLRAKAALYDELVETLAQAEEELARLREQPQPHGIDPAWRQIASELAAALRPYSMFGEQRINNGRIVVESAVPASTLGAATAALDRLARQLVRESHLAQR